MGSAATFFIVFVTVFCFAAPSLAEEAPAVNSTGEASVNLTREARQYGGYLTDPSSYSGPWSPFDFLGDVWEQARGFFGGNSLVKSIKTPFIVAMVFTIITGFALISQLKLVVGSVLTQLLPSQNNGLGLFLVLKKFLTSFGLLPSFFGRSLDEEQETNLTSIAEILANALEKYFD